jgi:tetratricopeptide (TPR) repeat protein
MKSEIRNPKSERKQKGKADSRKTELSASVLHPSFLILHPFSWWQPLVIIGAGILVYANSLHGAFVFDDVRAITNRHYIIDPLPAWKQLFSMARPLVNWSLAANYAVSGRDPWSYHLFNILVHIAAGLTLYALVRTTLNLCSGQPRAGRQELLALAVAVLFVVHPLQTESVDYIIQRAEALMGLFYLLSLYALVRAATESSRPGFWYGASILACALGMASKEPMVTAPVVALLYDQTFLAGSFRRALSARWKYYLGLAATWIVLAVPFQVAFGVLPDRAGGSGAGFYVPISPWQYLISESRVLLHYLGLVFWPRPLCLDYQWPLASSLGSVWLPCLIVVALLVVTAWCLWRHPIVGFLGASFFIILAPTSSIMPIVDLAFEHRMYLALAPVLVLIVFGFDQLATALLADVNLARVVTLGATMVAAFGLAILTTERNRDYESEVAIWRSTVKTRPENVRARFNLAEALLQRPQNVERAFAEPQQLLQEVLASDPDHVYALIDLGQILTGLGQTQEAMEHLRRAIAISPNEYRAHQALGVALLRQKQIDEGIQESQKALKLQPDAFVALFNMGQAMSMLGQYAEAVGYFEKAAAAPNAEPQKLVPPLTELIETAWSLATRPDPGHRDGALAVLIADAICRMTHQTYVRGLDTLAAAYAETGRFSDAQAAVGRAIRLASSPDERAQVQAMSKRLKLYEKGLPFRDLSVAGGRP